MAADNPLEGAGWHLSPLQDDSVISAEHLALVDFAQRLGTVTQNDEPDNAVDVRQHANLLMSLLSSPPHVVSDDTEHSSTSASSLTGSAAGTTVNDQHYLSDASNSTATTSSSTQRRDSFRFSHPSLSLDSKWKASFPIRTPCTAPEKEDGAVDSQPPAVLLGRALKVDDREAHRLSADAMARNLLLSIQKAIKWRIQSWMDTLSQSLVHQEQTLIRLNATEEEMRELLNTKEASLYVSLRRVAESIKVLHAETCFHVLPQRAQREHRNEEDVDSNAPIQKRRRVESEDSELRGMGETEYKYTVGHVLEFDGTIHLKTPAGYSEITVEVPGIIEGTFLSADPGMEDLTGVEVEIDTDVLASMVEKSCRVIVRSSLEYVFKEMAERQAEEEESEEESVAAERDAISPYPRGHGASLLVGSPRCGSAAIVTPRCGKPAPIMGTAEPGFLQIPDDLDDTTRKPRRITPHPHSPDTTMGASPFTPSTPSKSDLKRPLPSMVSPAPKVEFIQDTGFKLAKRGGQADASNGPNLPVLVEVACAAMQAKANLVGQ
ncbi:expressed unknown protein [Seminavis robusta]|uniref:Uncharacterized protein n=1 Tax=Seminavis robusta TaxID=568900 RepID=A0A9N8DE62_9STRA|nr:expressed unknown protein [Seminavis robusta]|eukprot:Sro30_g019910.1 n/a (548) ;mRNA; r:151117-152760